MQCTNQLLEQRIAEITRKENQAKAIQWQAVKDKAPDVAKFISDISKAFGKPAFVKVEVSGAVILDSSQINSARD